MVFVSCVGRPVGFKHVASSGFKPVECEGVVLYLGFFQCLVFVGLVQLFCGNA